MLTTAVIWFTWSAVCCTRFCIRKLRVHRGLQPLHHVQQLLHLGFQFHHFFGNGVGRHAAGTKKGKHRCRENSITKLRLRE